MRILSLFLLPVSLASALHAAEFSPKWHGTRIWVGPDCWANPMQEWAIRDGALVAEPNGPDRSVIALTAQIRGGAPAAIEMDVSLEGRAPNPQFAKAWFGGFWVGVRSKMDDPLHVAAYPEGHLVAGMRGDGAIVLGNRASEEKLPADRPTRIRLVVEPKGEMAVLRLEASQPGRTMICLKDEVPAEAAAGCFGIGASAPKRNANTPADRPSWRFAAWRASGDGVAAHPGRAFGPILWTQYTLGRGILKLTAQMPPVGEGDAKEVRLEMRRGDKWAFAAKAPIDPMSRTATFRIVGHDARGDVPYRALYPWAGGDAAWEGTIRAEPSGAPDLAVAAFSCDFGYTFPLRRIVGNIKTQAPDLLFFAGDQIYEPYGGFGITRQPTDVAMIDYLRKWFLFGWTWREVLRECPAVIIPDDHDVFQGNIWGHGGRPLPPLKPNQRENFSAGGYAMPPEWVNAVERTQTAHLPDPVDPAPIEQGIGVYFTELLYGGVSFAIVEDRKFKSGPGEALKGKAAAKVSDSRELDVPGTELLGPRQEAFLKRWANEPGPDMKVVLSQTIFCKATTHAGQELKRSIRDADCGGWPQSARDRALELIRPANAVMIHGDQHCGVLLRHGTRDWEDGPLAFMVPGTANGFPRAWWPEGPGENHVLGEPEWTGRYLDGLGNRMTIYAAANPEKGSNELGIRDTHPERLAHLKGSGYGIARLHKARKAVTFEMWRYDANAAAPGPGDQFEGFPRTMPVAP